MTTNKAVFYTPGTPDAAMLLRMSHALEFERVHDRIFRAVNLFIEEHPQNNNESDARMLVWLFDGYGISSDGRGGKQHRIQLTKLIETFDLQRIYSAYRLLSAESILIDRNSIREAAVFLRKISNTDIPIKDICTDIPKLQSVIVELGGWIEAMSMSTSSIENFLTEVDSASL